MRILYGVVGEGMGHATRSRVVIEHLLSRGHEVEVVVSGRAYDLLQQAFGSGPGGDVRRIHGLTMAYADNEVQKRLTLQQNLGALRRGLPRNISTYFESVEAFSPDVVLSDFESWSYLYAKIHRIPIISIDNMQVINRCAHPEALLNAHRKAFLLSKAIVKSKLPGASWYFATTFFFPPTRKERTTLVPPILRPEVLRAKRRANAAAQGQHVVVYQSGDSHDALIDVLRGLPETEFRIYGLRRDLADMTREDNLLFCPFSEQGFIDDLATARAVVAGGGFSLMGECVYLGRPLLSVPLRGQFEQILNAGWLDHLGYGLHRQQVTREDVRTLLARSDDFADKLTRHEQAGNDLLLLALDEKLSAVCAR